MKKLSVKEAEEKDLERIPDYFLNASVDFLHGMGVDPSKLPAREEWLKLLLDNYRKPFNQKDFFYLIWYENNLPVGHTNINKIIYGKEAYMHLHLWQNASRQKGSGTELVKQSLPYFFRLFELENLYCEPYSLNPAPNHTLKKAGFELEKQYETIPGWINFRQQVNRWVMGRERVFV